MPNEFVAKNGLISQNNVIVSGSVNISGSSGTLLTSNTDTLEITGSLLVTGSATFTGSLNVSGNISTPGTITAQTLVVQTITSSINFVTGSTKSGILTSNTHQFTGSVSASGSLAVNGSVLYVDGSNVGIGTISPSNKFVVSNAGASGLEIDPTGGVSSGVLLQAYNRSTSAYMAQSYYALSHTFNVGSGGGTRSLDINSNGNVGIGTTSPNAKLEVNGNIYTTSNTNFLLFGTSSAANSYIQGISDDSIAIGNKNTARLYVSSSGNVGIGTTSPLALLDIRGQMAIGFNSARTAGTALVFTGATDNTTNVSISTNTFGTGVSLVLGTGGSPTALTITNGGNVGIGTTNPGYKLTIQGSAGIEQSEEYFYFNSTYSVGNNARGKIRAVGTGGGSGYGGDLRLSSRASNNVWNEDALTISYTGNVGVNTPAPAYKFQSNGPNGDWSGYFKGSSSSGNSYGMFIDAGTTSADSPFMVRSADGATTFLRIRGDGNVGIGTPTPSDKLTVTDASTYTFNVGAASGGAGAVLYTLGSAALTFATSGSSNERIRITSGGNVGIGTTGPVGRLHIINASGAGQPVLELQQSNAGSNILQWKGSAGSYLGVISNDGNVGIGTTNPQSGVILDARGAAAVAGGSEGLRIGSVGDNSAYDNIKIYYTGYNSGAPRVYLTPRTTPGSGVISSFLHLQNSNGSSTTSNNTMGLLVDGNVGIGTTSPTTQFQIRNNYWQFWNEKSHNSNVDLFSITLPHFGAAIVTIAGSRYSPGADNYSGTSTFYIFVTNTGVVSVNGGSNFGTWTPTTSVSSKTVTFSSAYAGSSTNYTNASVVIQGSGHNNGSESALTVTIL